MQCECEKKFLSVSVTPLPSGGSPLFHIQTNCLNCGCGWAVVTDSVEEQDEE
jgi:hypothetical protein